MKSTTIPGVRNDRIETILSDMRMTDISLFELIPEVHYQRHTNHVLLRILSDSIIFMAKLKLTVAIACTLSAKYVIHSPLTLHLIHTLKVDYWKCLEHRWSVVEVRRTSSEKLRSEHDRID
jgi:hypothetical protein